MLTSTPISTHCGAFLLWEGRYFVLYHPLKSSNNDTEALHCCYVKPLCVLAWCQRTHCASGWDVMGRDKTSISDEMRVAVITMEGANTATEPWDDKAPKRSQGIHPWAFYLELRLGSMCRSCIIAWGTQPAIMQLDIEYIWAWSFSKLP